MIELIDRQSILKLNKIFASFIVDVQNVKYNPINDLYSPGIMFVDDNENPRNVSQEECDIWNNERQIEFDQSKDKIDAVSIKDKYIDEIVFKSPTNKADLYTEQLGRGLESFTNNLHWESTIFLLEYPTPWLSQDNDFEPVKKALDYLRSIGVAKDFIGGFKASGQELKELTKSLFWIIRCNASLPDCYFSGIDEYFVGNICKYGNAHFYFYSEKVRQGIIDESENVGLQIIDAVSCYDNFEETNKIEGRQINL
ncbi:MAG: hypothetical protein ABI663_17075 [Chryseolinea sp.]